MSNTLILSPEVTAALAFIQSIEVPVAENAVHMGREFYERFIPMAGEPEEVNFIQTHTIHSPQADIALRIYRPSAQPSLPIVLYMHGGWFNAGSLDTHDRPLRAVANLSGAVVISIDYRLAPEHPFPAGLHDCCYVLQWVMDNAALLDVDINRIALAGDSAGGALAATVTLRAVKALHLSLACQVLIYPVTDASLSSSSWQTFADGPNLTLAGAKDAWNMYIPDPNARRHPDASPLYADDLTGLPPTLIITAEYDPLRDEAIHYAEKLQAAGTDVQLSAYAGMIHGFFQMGGIISDGRHAIQAVAAFLKAHF
ncbi:alpha/beta hydrolase [Chitinophaga vietnamensis]|uniref:alpha/beta hydrolase n=1 Tax=Chitinophaga vietnamensis TaxID=2593957 RepID=UPI001177FC45|nr:alpha/beta hydrolase [Chitinophaga vietnamensis]